MNEFEFTAGSLEAQGLQEGDVVVCTYSDSDYFSVGDNYLIRKCSAGGNLFLLGDDGCDWESPVFDTVRFKPVSVNVQQQPQGQRLQDILPTCKEGDVLECVYAPGAAFHEGMSHVVYKQTDGALYILSNAGNTWRNTRNALFIKSDLGTCVTSDMTKEEKRKVLEQARQKAKDEHDSWGIGKPYTAPKKEWQPDTLDVDLTKKIWEW